jgi:hypothetical protein
MEWLMSALVILLGLLARFGVPIVFTLVIVLWMRHMDEQWKKQAERDQAFLSLKPRARNMGCWKINNCSPERRAACNAYAHPDLPCWQVFRANDGRLLETCIGCNVFKGAPIPT